MTKKLLVHLLLLTTSAYSMHNTQHKQNVVQHLEKENRKQKAINQQIYAQHQVLSQLEQYQKLLFNHLLALKQMLDTLPNPLVLNAAVYDPAQPIKPHSDIFMHPQSAQAMLDPIGD